MQVRGREGFTVLAISLCHQLITLEINTGSHLLTVAPSTTIVSTLILAGVQALTAKLTPG